MSPQFVILQAILGSYLLIQQPYNVRDVFICFDSNGTLNITWPSKWIRTERYLPNNIPTLKAIIPKNSTIFKVRMFKGNGSFADSDWISLNRKCSNEKSTISNTYPIMLYYISLCSTILITERLYQNVIMGVALRKLGIKG